MTACKGGNVPDSEVKFTFVILGNMLSGVRATVKDVSLKKDIYQKTL